MGLRLRRTPVVITRTLLGIAVMSAIAAPSTISLLANKIASASSLPDISRIHFAHATSFVRAAMPSDIAAQLVTYNATSSVEFYVDGNVTPIAGSDGGSIDADYHVWQLNTPLDAGSHTVRAKVTIGGERYDVGDTMTAYSLDVPTASYILPTAQNQVFKPGDTPLRVKIDNAFGQFESATISLYRYDAASDAFGVHIGDYRLSREQCDLQSAEGYAVCDASAATGWPSLDEGTYAVKLTTSTFAHNGIQADMEQYWTHFGIDVTAPGVNVRVEGAATVKNLLTVSASAYDANGLDSVGFYVTAPNDNGVCTADGARLMGWRSGSPRDDGRYYATLDVSDIDTHNQGAVKFCVTAVSRDKATNESQPDTSGFLIDHTAPVATLKVTSSSKPSASTPVSLTGTVDGISTLELYSDGVKVPDFSLSMNEAGQWSYKLDKGLVQGSHLLQVVATDPYGNVSDETSSPQSVTRLTVGAYVPPKEQQTLSSTLTPPRITSTLISTPSLTQIIASRHAAGAQKNADQAVLGAETTNSESTKESVVATGSSGWMLFGVAWYWWLLAGTLLVGIGSWVMNRRDAENQRIYA